MHIHFLITAMLQRLCVCANSERLLTAFFYDKEGSGNTAIWLAIKRGK